jgi:hypothetical protein
MGMIGRVLEFVKSSLSGDKFSDVKLDPGSGSNVQAQHFQPAGLDSQPLAQDAVLCIDASGVRAVAGYADTKAESEVAGGEVQMYGRDPTSGARVCRIWVKGDGTIMIEGDGDVSINGVIFTPGGDIDTSGGITGGEVTAGGIALSGHTHIVPPGTDIPGGVTQGPQ